MEAAKLFVIGCCDCKGQLVISYWRQFSCTFFFWWGRGVGGRDEQGVLWEMCKWRILWCLYGGHWLARSSSALWQVFSLYLLGDMPPSSPAKTMYTGEVAGLDAGTLPCGKLYWVIMLPIVGLPTLTWPWYSSIQLTVTTNTNDNIGYTKLWELLKVEIKSHCSYTGCL